MPIRFQYGSTEFIDLDDAYSVVQLFKIYMFAIDEQWAW
jgi:hypothetical protein